MALPLFYASGYSNPYFFRIGSHLPCFQNHFDHFTRRAVSARRLRYVMRDAFYFGYRVRGRHGESRAQQNRRVRQIVADVANLRVAGAGFFLDLRVRAEFLEEILVDVLHAEHFGAMRGGRRVASADPTGLQSRADQKAERHAVLGVKAFGFDQAIWSGQVIKMAVGETAIHVRQQDANSTKDFLPRGSRKLHAFASSVSRLAANAASSVSND